MVTIVIVSYNTDRLLKACIESIFRETNGTPFDIWVVDNNSHDNSVQMIKSHFSKVNLIENRKNIGFSKASNMVISQSKSDYILLLNPDTVILQGAIQKMVGFMDTNPEVGISGCRVLNKDGTLQLACRRSIPSPGVAFFRLAGLSKLFATNKMMAKYNLTYLDPDKPHEVDAVSGAFLMIRRDVVDSIGALDERFFMYGEELDWCLRTKKAGWKVMYYPNAEIIHYKGESTKSNSRKAAFEFYRAMCLFHKKHFANNYSPLVNFIVYIGIMLKAICSWKSFLFSTKVGSKR